jgi:monoterpene epsilon-lactone hydrolase
VASPEAQRIRAGLFRFPPAGDIEADRVGWEGWAATQPIPADVAETLTLVGGVSGRLLTPLDSRSDATIVAFHGGGLVSGASVTHRGLGVALALAAGRSVFLPDYRRLPEHSPDQVLADGVVVLGAARASGDLTVFADSSGAALALAAMQAMATRGDALPDRAVFLSPAVDATLSGASFHANEALDPTLSHTSLRHWQTVIGPLAPLDSPVLSPLFQPLGGLPPMLLLAGSDELWRDDAVRLSEGVAAAGGTVHLSIYPDMWHVWPMSGDMPETRQAFAEIAAFVG